MVEPTNASVQCALLQELEGLSQELAALGDSRALTQSTDHRIHGNRSGLVRGCTTSANETL